MTLRVKEWIVLGAGPHGVHMTCSLLNAGIPHRDILLLDRYPEPLYAWTRRTGVLGMDYLRSTVVHHLDVCPWSLERYAKERYGKPENWSARPYQRPAYQLFQEHCRWVMAKYRIDNAYSQVEVESVRREIDGTFLVQAGDRAFRGRNLILCLGQPKPRYPEWVEPGDPRVYHLLGEAESPSERDVRMVVLGAGMSGAQFCLDRARGHSMTLLTPHPLRTHDFDADPCWIGPKCLNEDFWSLTAEEKRKTIAEARQPGTLNDQVFQDLTRAISDGEIQFRLATVQGMTPGGLYLNDGSTLAFDRLVLATGFEKNRPGGRLVSNLINELQLPTASCGYPLTDSNLQWTEGLFVTGGLAELTLGPVSRNITGARSAAKLITQCLSKEKKLCLSR